MTRKMKKWIVWDNYNKTFQRIMGTLTEPHGTWVLVLVDDIVVDELVKARFKVVQKTKKRVVETTASEVSQSSE